MATVRITKRTADSFGSDGSSGVIWDRSVAGFGLRLRSQGKKYFVLKYRANSRQRWYTIGLFGSPWTVESARIEAKRLLVEVANGVDPAAARDANRNAKTVADLCDLYMENHAKLHKKPRSWKSDESNIRNHVRPLIGHLNAKSITRNDIEKFKRDVANGKTARNKKTKPRVRLRVKGGQGTANRCLALLSKMFNLAEEWGLRDEFTNPVRGIQKFPERKLERYLSNQEITTLGETLSDAVDKGLADQTSVDAIRLLMFTGCRLSEILTLKWKYVDFQRNCFHLPDSKTGAKVVYLPAAAISLLKEIPRLEDNPFVLVGSGEAGHLVNLRKPWHRIREKAGLDDVRLHDLRHSFASIAAGEGMSLHMIGQLLGHSQAATTARYAHLAENPMKAAADKIGTRIDGLMNGNGQIDRTPAPHTS